MPLTVCLFEDSKVSQFYPLTHLRPFYMLRPGIEPLYARVQRAFPEARLLFLSRELISPLISEEKRNAIVNIIKREGDEVLFLNGRIRDFGDIPKMVKQSRFSTLYLNGSEKIGLLLKDDSLTHAPPVAFSSDYIAIYQNEKKNIHDFDTTATLFNYCWELVNEIPDAISSDFTALKSGLEFGKENAIADGAVLVNREEIYLGQGVHLAPMTLLDASEGPIYVGSNCRVESQAAIIGPCYIGPNSIVAPGRVSKSSIGHTCRVGGEVDNTVFHSYVNKYHAGFIGHSYVGSWVNFGAMTTNSDLKNNYSTIRVHVNGESVDTGSIKVGSFIGDHTKFGIGTLLNTGISIGACCNIYGGNLIAEKEIGSFVWGTSGNFQEYQMDKALDTIRKSMERRQVELSPSNASALESIQSGSASMDGIVEL